MRDLFHLLGRQLDPMQKVQAHLIAAERIIYREHNVVDTDGIQGDPKRRLSKNAARGNVKLRTKSIDKRPLILPASAGLK